MDTLETAAAWAFWASLFVLAYTYLGYPATLAALRGRAGPPTLEPVRCPAVSIVIAAHNEEAEIGDTVRNKLALDYPRDLVQVIVVSDGSTDRTDAIVASLRDDRVLLLRQEPRQGKTAALNRAREAASGEIVVFADANSRYERDALRRLVAVFDDRSVGYATGKLVYVNPGEAPSAASCGLYMRYENWIRRLETRAGSIVGVNGGIDAVRRDLFAPMRPDQLPDFVLPLRVVEQGYRVVFQPAAVSYETALSRSGDEFRMRVRVALRSMWTLWEMRHLLAPRHGRFAFQLLVHKVLRYLLFVPMAVALLANLLLVAEPVYAVMAAAQALVYLGGAVGLCYQRRGSALARVLGIPAFFLLTNAAAAVALSKLARGQRQVLWQPRGGA
jgi:cellulose synthase/poly-beta-1,6-N-acetylglucosamine synthase-like glycosyltransferase